MTLKSESYRPSPYSKTIAEGDAKALADLLLTTYPPNRGQEPIWKQRIIATGDDSNKLIIDAHRHFDGPNDETERIEYTIGDLKPVDYIATPEGELVPAEVRDFKIETYSDGTPISVETVANNQLRETSQAAVAKLYGQLALSHEVQREPRFKA